MGNGIERVREWVSVCVCVVEGTELMEKVKIMFTDCLSLESV